MKFATGTRLFWKPFFQKPPQNFGGMCGESRERERERERAVSRDWKYENVCKAKKIVYVLRRRAALAVFSSLSLSFYWRRMTERVKPKARVFWKHTPKVWLTRTMCCWEVFRAKRARDEKNKHGERRTATAGELLHGNMARASNAKVADARAGGVFAPPVIWQSVVRNSKFGRTERTRRRYWSGSARNCAIKSHHTYKV